MKTRASRVFSGESPPAPSFHSFKKPWHRPALWNPPGKCRASPAMMGSGYASRLGSLTALSWVSGWKHRNRQKWIYPRVCIGSWRWWRQGGCQLRPLSSCCLPGPRVTSHSSFSSLAAWLSPSSPFCEPPIPLQSLQLLLCPKFPKLISVACK